MRQGPDRRPALWLALLVAASVAFTLGFACAMPYAGLGAAAAATLRRRDALLFTLAAWLANQIVGFAVLGYPWTANALAWSPAFAVVALLTTFAAQGLVGRTARPGALTMVVTFLGAFVVYEGALFVIAATLLGGTDVYTAPIIARVFAINAAAFVLLLVFNRVGTAIGLAVAPRLRFATDAH